jgi:hypothetical protein
MEGILMSLLFLREGKKPDRETIRLDIVVSGLKMEDKRRRDFSKGGKLDICHLHQCVPPVGPAMIEALFQPARQPCCFMVTSRNLGQKLCVLPFQVLRPLRTLTPPTRRLCIQPVPCSKRSANYKREGDEPVWKNVNLHRLGKIRYCSKRLLGISHWPTEAEKRPSSMQSVAHNRRFWQKLSPSEVICPR